MDRTARLGHHLGVPAGRPRRLEVGARTRAAVFQLGVLVLVISAARLAIPFPATAVGWSLVLAHVLAVAAVGARWPAA